MHRPLPCRAQSAACSERRRLGHAASSRRPGYSQIERAPRACMAARWLFSSLSPSIVSCDPLAPRSGETVEDDLHTHASKCSDSDRLHGSPAIFAPDTTAATYILTATAAGQAPEPCPAGALSALTPLTLTLSD
ncbi:hypothetical protein CC78DRAFT_229104 [Lojkania enalia]|uniref:Uncharacterized protein n=1 Tax=Lojkania enalia TaxID=147567 RepID=A0A9P4K9G2_9PLEO|nr:hypothetical protein CC78DRAFT_229104 [Didymosphaeria enalia]